MNWFQNSMCENLLNQGLSEPEFYGDLVYKFKNMGWTDFSDQFRKIMCHKRTGYDLNVMQQSACMLSD